MKYISHRINSSTIEEIFNLPPEYRNMEVEVLIIPLKDVGQIADGRKSMVGILNEFCNPHKIEYENAAWRNAVKEKYANS